MNMVKAVALSAAVMCVPSFLTATPIDFAALGYETTGSLASVEIEYDDMAMDGEGIDFDLGAFFALDFDTLSSFGSFDVLDPAEYALAFDSDGTVTNTVSTAFSGASAISLMDGTIEALIEDFIGTGVYASVDAVIATLSTDDLVLDTDPMTGEVLGYFDFAEGSGELTVQALKLVAPVPVPAGLPLLLSGIGAVAWMNRRRKAA